MKKLIFKQGRFIFQPNCYINKGEYNDLLSIPCSEYDRKTKLITAGWWMAEQVEKWAKLYNYEYDKKIITENCIRAIDNIMASLQENYLRPGKFFPFQAAGIEYGKEKKDLLLADEMGLGKTIQAIGILNSVPWGKILIVCPASLRLNWKQELQEWLDTQCIIDIQIPNNKLTLGDITIINYAKLSKFAAELNQQQFDYVIYDESHYLKNPKAKRTKLCFGCKKVIHADRRIFITGTPILNRPIEIFPLLKELGIETNWKRFVNRFCDAKEKTIWTSGGRVTTLDVTGSSNEDELQEILRSTIMIRRLKKDVLTQLPEKTRQIVLLPENGNISNVKKERLEFAKAMKQPNLALAISSFAELRQQNALKKIKFAKEYIDNLLEQKEKVVIFAWHVSVIDELKEALKDYKMSVITGSTKLEKRQDEVNNFQIGENRIFIGNIQAAGTGITLTASSDVVFLEMDWTPGNNIQAEDRIHRIGQTNNCHVHYLVYEDSVDAYIAKKVVDKKAIIEKILD